MDADVETDKVVDVDAVEEANSEANEGPYVVKTLLSFFTVAMAMEPFASGSRA